MQNFPECLSIRLKRKRGENQAREEVASELERDMVRKYITGNMIFVAAGHGFVRILNRNSCRPAKISVGIMVAAKDCAGMWAASHAVAPLREQQGQKFLDGFDCLAIPVFRMDCVDVPSAVSALREPSASMGDGPDSGCRCGSKE